MQYSFKSISVLFILCFIIISCEADKIEYKDNLVPLPAVVCISEVSYRGTNVCSNESTAAAVAFADSSLLIISNFFDFADSTTIMEDDIIYIDYDLVDSSLFNSGVLCGVSIVAPVTEISCFELN